MRPHAARSLPTSRIVLFGIQALLFTGASGPGECVSASPGAGDEDAPALPVTSAPEAHGIEVDLERHEIRFPCRFVNPTQLLEVFACHQRGPTHETLVAFDAPGPAIFAGLLQLGCRNASYWNGTSPRDFEKNQGDRLLVLVRWKLHGVEHEQPAEGMLLEGETAFPMPVRGFSFGARGAFRVDVPAERDAAEEPDGAEKGARADGEAEGENDADAAEARLERTSGVPIAVEISLGASVRQSVPHSLLSHPTSSARLNPWMLFPAVDPVAVPERRELVEKEVPATLIVRRIRSEAALVRLAGEVQVRRGVAGAAAIYESAAPIAQEIDRLKGEYEKILVSAREILEAEGARKEADAKESEKAAKRALALVYRGRWLSARIEERYLSLYELEERLKRDWLGARSGIPEDVREDALVRSRDGFRYEPLLASKEVEIAALDLDSSGKPPAEKAVLRRILAKEIEALQLERNQRLASASLRNLATRTLGLKDDDTYILSLFAEDEIRAKNAICRYEAEARVVATVIQELRLGLEGRWEVAREATLRERALAEERLRIVGLEDKLVETLTEIRWNQSSEESDDPERREEAKAKRLELQAARSALEKEIRESLASLEAKKNSAAPPGGK